MKFSSSPARLAVLGFAVSCAPWVRAQNSGAPLDEVVVTAMRFAAPHAGVVSSLDVITRQDIERLQPASLADALRGLSGFEFGRNGGPGTATSFFLRGHNSTNVVVLIDGQRAPTDGIGSLLAVDLPMAWIERIEVLRGDASALYGGAANGGVIQIITRKAEGQYAEVGFGSRDRQSLQTGLSRKWGNAEVSLRVGQDRSARLSAMNTAQKPLANPDLDQSVTDNYALDLGLPLHPDHRLRLSLSRLESKVDYDDDKDSDGWSPGNPANVHRMNRSTDLARAVLSSRLAPHWTSDLAWSQNRQTIEDRQNGVLRTADYAFGLAQSEQSSVRWDHRFALSDQTTLLLGADALNESFRTDARLSGYRFEKDNLGVFAGLSHERQRWSFQLNARTDRLTTRNLINTTTAKDTQDTTLAGVAYRLGAAWSLTASASTGFRAPSVGEQAAASTLLRNELFSQRELGLSYRLGAQRFRLSVFEADMRDMIAYRGYDLTNLPARNRGLETSGQVLLGRTTVTGSLTVQDPVNLDSGLQLARRAKRVASLGMVHPMGQVQLSARANYQSHRRDSDFTSDVLRPYATLDLGAAYAVNARSTLRVSLDNVTDRQYQTAYGYNAPRRGAFFTWTYRDR